ncbi:hypothetical protein HU200_054613 [Digitaria exilis]|uniref:Uncharacterized protein n=1 Tax=Digitaria exilis TaxID=1010633 RepID=A0A835AI95_9POAL|nr:hypothetical protein HU200_054613 [Digitaria exilis]
MRLFVCFGGSATLVDDDDDDDVAAAVVAARQRRGRSARSLSFRGNFLLPGSRKDKAKKPSPAAEARKKTGVDADDAYGLLTRASTAASLSALPSSAAAASLDSGFNIPSASSSRYSTASSSSTSSSSSSSSARSSTASSSRSVSGELFSPAAAKRRTSNNKQGSSSPAAGAAAVVLCLLMVVFCGPVGATLLMSMALYLFPRRWPARMTPRGVDGVGSPECDAEEATTARTPTRRKVVMDQGFLVRNRKKCQ